MLLLFCSLLLFVAAETWTVDKLNGSLHVRRGLQFFFPLQTTSHKTAGSGGIATANEKDERTQNGWVQLTVETKTVDEDHIFAAGYLEGFIHQHLTFAAFVNFANSKLLWLVAVSHLRRLMDRLRGSTCLPGTSCGGDDEAILHEGDEEDDTSCSSKDLRIFI